MNKIVGIYKIENAANGKVYIGQSINIDNRLMRHRSSLKSNVHKNPHLQSSYNKYGPSYFELSIIEECSREVLDDREQYWIDHYKENIYNIILNVLDFHGENNWNFGKKPSKHSRRKMSLNHPKRKLTSSQIKEIKSLLLLTDRTNTSIAVEFKVNQSTISRIKAGDIWSWIK